MTLQKLNISDHIHLSCIQTPKFKTGILTLSLTMPLNTESFAYNSILSSILRRGTKSYPDISSFNRRLDELYAACVEIRSHRVGHNLCLSFTVELLDEAYSLDQTKITDGVLELLAELILSPKMKNSQFDPDEVAQEIRFAQDGIRSQINNTRAYAAIRCAELMYRNDPNYPTMKALQELLPQIDSQKLTAYYQKLLRSSSLQAFYVGSLSAEEISEKICRLFAPWRISIPYSPQLPSAETHTEYLSLTEKMPVSQGKLSMGLRTGACISKGSDNSYVALVFNEIFGGSPASKLFMNVREKMSLCYYCSSSYSRYTGIITVSAGIETDKRKITEQAILQQLEDIRQGKISEIEMNAAKTSLENSYRQIYDNPFELQNFYGDQNLFGFDTPIEECRKRIASVTKDEVIKLSNSVICDTVFFVEGTQNSQSEEEDSNG